MPNNTLEQSLRTYCKTLDSNLFSELYNPLSYIASNICSKYKVSRRMLQDGIIADMVSHIAIKLPEYYIESKGKAKNAAYILMAQYLLNLLEYNNKDKRSINKTVYIEDQDCFEGVVEITIDTIELLKSSLVERQELFNKIKNKLHFDVSQIILDCVKEPQNYKVVNNSYVKSIAKKAQTSNRVVYNVIKQMNRLVNA